MSSKYSRIYTTGCIQDSSKGENEHYDTPLVSIVMPNFNGQRYLRDSIESALKQTYKNIELIIVDDCSTDRSLSIIDEYINHDSRIHLIQNTKNCGVAITRNIGISCAKGDYIALLDNDDTWNFEKIERQLATIMNGADIAFCSYDFIDEHGKPIKKPFIVPKTATYRSMLTSSVISCSTAFINASVLKSHPFRTDVYHEDYLLWMELIEAGYKAVGDQTVLMHYRQVSGSRSNRKSVAAMERWKIFRNQLHLSIPRSLLYFLGYSINGILKYYL